MQIERSNKPRRTVRRTINAATAAEAVGPITRGIEVYGLSKGQFSLIELVEHVLGATGPADVVISTWTAAGADLAHTAGFLADGRVRSCRWLVDFSFPARQPAYCEQLVDRFGADAIRCTANHAKFVLVANDEWNVVIRTSMNLNLNRRLESYELSDDVELADWLRAIVEDAFAGGASPIDNAPSIAQRTINTMAGRVSNRPPNISTSEPPSTRVAFGAARPKGVGFE